MNMNIIIHKNFKKKYQDLQIKERSKVSERLKIFRRNPFNPILNNYPLRGKYNDYRSINITGDLRAIYKRIDDNEVRFITIGSHSGLYR